jgi:hypothetical protein
MGKRKNDHQSKNYFLVYTISSCSIYKNKEAIVTAGKTNPTRGTKIDGR